MSNVIEIIPTNKELLERFYGSVPSRTLKSLTVLDKGEPIAIGGIYREHEWYVMFMDVMDGIKPRDHKRILLKCSKILIKKVQQLKLPVYSLADPEIVGSDILLEHMGFEQIYGDVYQWQN